MLHRKRLLGCLWSSAGCVSSARGWLRRWPPGPLVWQGVGFRATEAEVEAVCVLRVERARLAAQVGAKTLCSGLDYLMLRAVACARSARMVCSGGRIMNMKRPMLALCTTHCMLVGISSLFFQCVIPCAQVEVLGRQAQPEALAAASAAGAAAAVDAERAAAQIAAAAAAAAAEAEAAAAAAAEAEGAAGAAADAAAGASHASTTDMDIDAAAFGVAAKHILAVLQAVAPHAEAGEDCAHRPAQVGLTSEEAPLPGLGDPIAGPGAPQSQPPAHAPAPAAEGVARGGSGEPGSGDGCPGACGSGASGSGGSGSGGTQGRGPRRAGDDARSGLALFTTRVTGRRSALPVRPCGQSVVGPSAAQGRRCRLTSASDMHSSKCRACEH